MKLMTLALTIGLTASAAMANDHLIAIADGAKGLQDHYTRMAGTLKNKNFVLEDLKRELSAARGHVAELQAIATQFEASSPGLTATQQQEWKVTKDLIALLDIFHDRKDQMLNGDNPSKQRKALRSEAEQQAKRSTVLQNRAMSLSQAVN